jgi:hypothetical protein
MTIPIVLAAAMTAMCVLLTVAFLGALRGVAELRLHLRGYAPAGLESLRLAAGNELPEQLVGALPRPGDDALIVFLSSGCQSCWELAVQLEEVGVDQVLACMLAEDQGLRDRLPTSATVAELGVARSAADALGVRSTPLVVLQRDGYILGTAAGVSAQSAKDLQRLVAGVPRVDPYVKEDMP